MFGFLLCRRKKAKAFTWKVLKMLQSRLLLLKHQKYAKARHIRMDIADYIRSNDSTNALLRTEQLFLVENSISVYDLLLQFTDFIIRRFSPIRKHGELVNDDTSEAVSTLIYASVKCKDIPEMLTLSELVGQRYGQRYVTTAIQVLPGNLVNTEIKKKLSISSVSEHVKCRMVEEIAKESGYRLEILRLEHKSEIENEVFDVKEKKVMDLDKEERSKKESPQEVYKFILTDVKDERSKKEISMKDDYIEDVMKSRLLAEKAKKSGHRLEILRPEYKPEIEKQVYEEEEKKVIDPDMDITSYEEPPHEVYKFSLTNFEEGIMEDDYVEDVKCRTLDEIMKKSGHRLEISRRKYKPEDEKQVYEEEEKKVIDPDVDIRSYEESPHEVYKFSLTDFEEEIMEDDYVEDVKCRTLDEIMKKSGHRLEISKRENKPENEKQVYEEVEKKVIDPDVDMRSYEESPHKVYKFSLTDFEEEIMEDDYIEDVKCRLLDEIMKSGHRLEISRREYKPEIEKQVYEEEEKKVIDPDMDIRSYEESPDKVYNFSLTDFEEEIMEDDYIEDVKSRLLAEIKKKCGHRLEVLRPEYKPEIKKKPEIEKQVNEEEEKKVMNMDESQEEVEKYFSLTDVEEERSNEDTSMENDYIDDVKCSMVDKITKKFGHLLEILRPEYSRLEIGKQVNEEKEKKVMNMDIRSADQSPYEVYKISLTDVEEERSKEDTSMEDDYIEDGQVGKDQRVFRFRKSSEEKRKPSSPLSTLMEFRNTESLTYYMRQTRTHQRRRRSSTSPHCRHCVEYNEFKVKKEEEEEEEERQSLKTKNVHSKLHEYEKFLTQFKKKKEAENERRRLFPKGFEPTLPDYDEVITRFRALEAKEEERQRLAATKHIHPKLPDYDQIVAQFKALKEEEKQRQRI
ncbi:unnamed protein product [Arabidopsis halleri]